MDSMRISRHLALAEDHVADGGERVARQRSLVAELKKDGHDVTLANEVLHQLESVQTQFVTDRDRLRKELQAALVREGHAK